MTNKQIETLVKVLKRANTLEFKKGEYEIKRYEVEECHYFVSVFLEVGQKNDEGTLASIICRDKVQLFIGKRGGITYPVKSKQGKYITRRLERGQSLLIVSLAQHI